MSAICDCLDKNRPVLGKLLDSASQLIDDLELHLRQLRQLNRPGIPFIIGECEQALREIRNEIRALA